MLDYLVDQLVTEGKTKEIWGVKGVPGLVIAQYKNAITAHNDPKYTKEFSTKAEHSNTINCRVFELLRRKGIFAAFLYKKIFFIFVWQFHSICFLPISYSLNHRAI